MKKIILVCFVVLNMQARGGVRKYGIGATGGLGDIQKKCKYSFGHQKTKSTCTYTWQTYFPNITKFCARFFTYKKGSSNTTNQCRHAGYSDVYTNNECKYRRVTKVVDIDDDFLIPDVS